MPRRKIILAPDQIYHVFNRGVGGMPIFLSPNDYLRYLNLVKYYRFANTRLSFSLMMKCSTEERQKILEALQRAKICHVEILAFCFMPNHFHFLLKQITKEGIRNFMGNIQNGYAKYINTKEKRSGPLFQSTFKAKIIETEEQLLHVSRYIHLNPSAGYLTKFENLTEYPWSSLNSYLKEDSPNEPFISTELIAGYFKDSNKYQEFIFDRAQYQRELGKIKHLILD